MVQRYAGRPVLRELVHRGGLRADILTEGEIRVGDEVRAWMHKPLHSAPERGAPARLC